MVDRVRIIKDVFYIVALFIAGVWGIVTFWYQSSYLPAHEPPLVTPTMALTVLGEKDGRVAINADLVLKNEGKARRETWGMTFHAYGRKVSMAPVPDGGWSDSFESATSFSGFRDFREAEPVLLASSVDLMTAHGRSNPIMPHSELHQDFHFYADRSSSDTVVVVVNVLYPDEGHVAPRPEWFTLEHKPGGEVVIRPTPVCRASPDCKPYSTDFDKTLSLWTSAPDRRDAADAAAPTSPRPSR